MYKKMFKELGLFGQCEYVDNMIRDINQSMDNISNMIPDIKKSNSGLVEEMIKILKGE